MKLHIKHCDVCGKETNDHLDIRDEYTEHLIFMVKDRDDLCFNCFEKVFKSEIDKWKKTVLQELRIPKNYIV